MLYTLTDLGKERLFLFRGRFTQNRRIGFGFLTEHKIERRVAPVIENHVRQLTIRPLENPVTEIPILFQRLTLVGKHRGPCIGNRGGRMILGRIDVAARPAHISAKCFEGLDQDSCLDRHVKGTGNARALKRLFSPKFLARRHQARHFGFGDLDFLAAVIGKRQVANGIICRHGWSL